MADRRIGSRGRWAAAALLVAGIAGGIALTPHRKASAQPAHAPAVRAGGQLASFKSDADFLAFLQKRRDAVRRKQSQNYEGGPPSPPPPAAPAPMSADAASPEEASVMVTGTRMAAGDKITNT